MRRHARRALAVGAAVSAGLFAGAAYTRMRVRAAERRVPAAGAFADAGGVRLHVVEAGAGTPVVLLHGADGVLQEFTRTIFDDIAGEARAVAFDRPGHGWSEAAPGATHDVAENVRVLRIAVQALGVGPAILVGHSYGSLVALRWALDHPADVLGLVLLSPPGSWSWPVPRAVLRLPSVPILGPVLTEALTGVLGPPILKLFSLRAFHPSGLPRAYAEFSSALFLRPSQVIALADEYGHLADDIAAILPRCGTVTVPVEIVVGRNDHVVPLHRHAEALARAIPTAELRILPRTGHQLMWSAPEEALAAVRRVRERASV